MILIQNCITVVDIRSITIELLSVSVGGRYNQRQIILTLYDTVNFLNIRTHKKFVVITLKVEQDGFFLE